jgi:hypothetical protein
MDFWLRVRAFVNSENSYGFEGVNPKVDTYSTSEPELLATANALSL